MTTVSLNLGHTAVEEGAFRNAVRMAITTMYHKSNDHVKYRVQIEQVVHEVIEQHIIAQDLFSTIEGMQVVTVLSRSQPVSTFVMAYGNESNICGESTFRQEFAVSIDISQDTPTLSFDYTSLEVKQAKLHLDEEAVVVINQDKKRREEQQQHVPLPNLSKGGMNSFVLSTLRAKIATPPPCQRQERIVTSGNESIFEAFELKLTDNDDNYDMIDDVDDFFNVDPRFKRLMNDSADFY